MGRLKLRDEELQEIIERATREFGAGPSLRIRRRRHLGLIEKVFLVIISILIFVGVIAISASFVEEESKDTEDAPAATDSWDQEW